MGLNKRTYLLPQVLIQQQAGVAHDGAALELPTPVAFGEFGQQEIVEVDTRHHHALVFCRPL